MKRFIIIILSSVVLFVLACEKEVIEVPVHYGTASIVINGDSLNFKVGLRKTPLNDSLYSILFEYYNDRGLLRKQFSCAGFKLNFEKQIMYDVTHNPKKYPFTGYGTLLSDGDVAGTNYFLNETAPEANYIQITAYNEVTKEVKGAIWAIFYKDVSFFPYNPEPAAPDTILINGVFDTKILD